MAKQVINIGTRPNSKDGDAIRDAFNKVNSNFNELYALTSGTVDGLTELAQDYAAGMFTSGTHTGITVDYDDVANKLNLTVPPGFSGDYVDLTNKPSIPADLTDLTDLTSLLWDKTTISNSLIPDTNTTHDLGSPTNRFRTLYLSGNTIDLGGALISTTDDGNVSVPGVTETKFKPGSIEDGRQGAAFFNETALPEDSVIIDQATWIWAAVGGNQSGGTFQPSVYSATFNGSGFITAISIVEANYYDDTNSWVTVNRDNLYVVPAGTLLTAQSISAVGSPIGVLNAGVISTSDSVFNAPSLNVPADISDLTDTQGLLGQSGQIDPLVLSERYTLGTPVEFVRPDNVDISDNIDTGLTLSRDTGEGGGIWNPLGEVAENQLTSPYGTEWNWDGWDNLDNVKIRRYRPFRETLRNNVGDNIIGAKLVMHDTINDKYYTFEFSAWARGPAHTGAFSYTRRLIDTTKNIGVIFADGTLQVSAHRDYTAYPQTYVGDVSTYTLQLSDGGGHIYAFQSTIYIPSYLTTNFPVGTVIQIVAGRLPVTVSPAYHATAPAQIMRNASSTQLSGYTISAYSSSHLIKVEKNTWNLTSDEGLIGQRLPDQNLKTTDNVAFNSLTLAGDIRSEQEINIDINLSDSTLRRWTFTEGGDLTLPTGFIKPSTTDKGLIIEGPNYADFVTQEGGGISTISNGVNIVTHRAGSNAERRWTFAWDGALYPPNEPGDYQIGTIEWRQTAPYDITNQIRTTEGNGVDQFPGLKLVSYANPVINDHAITLEAGFNNRWIFKNDSSLIFPNGAVIKDNADSSVSFGGGAGATNQGAGAVAIGEGAGNNTQSNQAVAIGRGSGNYQQGVGAVGVGFCAGATEQGDYAVAIGFKAARGNMDNDGTPNQPANSIMINASSTPLNGDQAGLYINPVREDTGNTAKAVYYNTTTKELTYANPTGGGGDGANLVSDNDINITINSPDSTSYNWNFNQLGRIQIPDINNQVAGYIGDVFENGGGFALQAVPGGYVELTTSDQNIGFYIQELSLGTDPLINPEAALYTTGGQWSFYQDGRTAFPGPIDLGGQALKKSSTLEERTGGVGSAPSNVAVLDKYRHMTLNNQIGTLLTGNFTVNFTSVDLPSDYIARFSVFLRQGATGYYPNVFQINGTPQTLVWENSTPPTPTSSAGAIDLFEFVVYGGSLVLGRMRSYS